MKILTAKYRDNLRFTLVRLISTGMAYCFISSANATVLTIGFTASGGSLGDGSFHFHREETYKANGDFISSNSASDASGTITGQFKYETASMPADSETSPSVVEYQTTGGPSWSNSALTASPASGLGTPSYEYSSNGTVGTDFRFAASGFGGGLLRVTDFALSTPGPFGGTPNSAMYDLFVPGVFNSTLLTTQVIDGKEVPTGINLANMASNAHVNVNQTVWRSNSADNTFTKIIDNWSAPVTNVTIPPIPEPQTYAMMLAGLSLLGWQVRRRSN